MKRILFSPVGSTDPISGQHDGALLHIIRTYRPHKVYTYMSKEICELEDKDQRYSYCLDKIQEQLGIAFEVEHIRRPELVDVHIFDYFLTEFRSILTEIYEDGDEVLLNVSSGTPAMKGALQNLCAIFEKPLIPIQVSTPKKEINDREDVKGDYNVEIQWECNLDNEEGYINRCSVSSFFNMLLEMKKSLIKRHLAVYDYVAALRIAETIESGLSKEVITLIEAGAARLKLDKSTCDKRCREVGYKMFPKESTDQWLVFEHLMVLKIKLVKEEYADYLRAISPLFFVLMERVLKKSGKINLDAYMRKNRDKKQWNFYETQKNPLFDRVFGEKRPSFITTDHYAKLIKELNIGGKTSRLTEEIRKVEMNIRNSAAHTIRYITDEVIKSDTGMNAVTIFNKLKELAILSGVNISSADLLTYDKLNQEIEKYMARQ